MATQINKPTDQLKSLQRVAKYIKSEQCKKITILTGAGISVSGLIEAKYSFFGFRLFVQNDKLCFLSFLLRNLLLKFLKFLELLSSLSSLSFFKEHKEHKELIIIQFLMFLKET